MENDCVNVMNNWIDIQPVREKEGLWILETE